MGFRKLKSVRGIASRLSLGGNKKGKTDESKASADTPDTSPDVTPEQHADPLSGPESAAAGPTASQKKGTDADEVLSGILQDLSIDPELAIQPNSTDDVSEYTGGSAKSVESDSSEEEGEKEISIGEKVNMVIAAADEIRRKKSSSPPQAGTPLASASSGDTPATEPGDETKEETEPKTTKKRVSRSKSKSPTKDVKTNRSTPQHLSADEHAEDTGEESGAQAEFSADFEGQDFRDPQDDKAVDTSTHRTESIGDTTFDEDVTFVSGDETGELESASTNKGSVMNKDIIIHQPGGPKNLVVRAMYYTPLPSIPEEVIIKVEVSRLTEFLLNHGRC